MEIVLSWLYQDVPIATDRPNTNTLELHLSWTLRWLTLFRQNMANTVELMLCFEGTCGS